MCGICCILHRGNDSTNPQAIGNKDLLLNRGPNGYSEVQIEPFFGWRGCFAGSTLWMQGSSIKLQPLKAPNGAIFLWNGDKYSEGSSGEVQDNKINDSDEVFSKVTRHGISYLNNVNGPYAFIYFDIENKELWFGRDALGRHSLLWSVTQDTILLTSVGCSSQLKVTEVPNSGLFKIDLSSTKVELLIYPWSHLDTSQAIHAEVPVLISDEKMQHKILHSSFSSWWINVEPQIPGIIQIEGEQKEASLIFEEALDDVVFCNIIKELEDIFLASVKTRIKTKPDYCKDCILSEETCCHSKLGILFSGGLDSALIALVANNFVDDGESIDLFNVAFQRGSKFSYDSVPDRITGQKTLQELKFLCPRRIWNFVEINVSTEELNKMRNQHISRLINPLTSILDDSLGCALWFAARGKGLVNGEMYHSPCRVVLLGMGADELFGGYTKQRKIFMNEGWDGLGRELCRGISNIGIRNLGRDNRVVADHGRQPRTPYLDEHLITYVDSLPPWNRCYLYPKIPIGIGDKFILRLLAWKLGLRGASTFPKKALQFGSQIANPKERGHLTSERLVAIE